MFQKVSNVKYRKTLCKRTEYHDFPSIFFCLGPGKIRWGTLRYIRKVRLSKNFMPKRAISAFSAFSRFIAFKFRWGTPLCFRIFGTSKTFCSVGGYRDSPLIFLASQYWKISWVTPSNFRKNSGIETFYAWERKNTFLTRNLLSHSTQKTPGNHL